MKQLSDMSFGIYRNRLATAEPVWLEAFSPKTELTHKE
jgi:hypothetical protein